MIYNNLHISKGYSKNYIYNHFYPAYTVAKIYPTWRSNKRLIYAEKPKDLDFVFSAIEYNVDGLFFDLKTNSLISLTFKDFIDNGLKLMNKENNIEKGRIEKLKKFEKRFRGDIMRKRQYKESIYNTSLPIIIIRKADLYYKYYDIGSGSEGSAYIYDNDYCFKLFDNTPSEKLELKYKKIEELAKLKDESFAFPIGLVGFKDMHKEGYYMNLVDVNEKYEDFNELDREMRINRDIRKILYFIKEGDKAIKRIHQKGVIIGDTNRSNIMIDSENRVRFIDTDNYAFKDYTFDLDPAKYHYLEQTYKRKFLPTDCDKYSYALLCMHLLYPDKFYYRYLMEEFVKSLDIEPKIKDGLQLIFSDAENKPYISDVLDEVDPSSLEKVLKK